MVEVQYAVKFPESERKIIFQGYGIRKGTLFTRIAGLCTRFSGASVNVGGALRMRSTGMWNGDYVESRL